MGRQSIAEQRRIQIGRALQACMLEKGSYESTSVKDIAQRADMAAGLIHHYFKSKDEILMLVARMLFESIRNDIDELYLARDEAGKREQLHELVGRCDRNRFVMMLYSLSLSMPEVKELVAEERALLFNALASRLKRGAKAVPNPEKSAASLLFFFESAIMQSALFDQAPAEDLLMEVLVDQFLSL